jgi:hypothetical protein
VRLRPEEPAAGPWRRETPSEVLRDLLAGLVPRRLHVVAVDGRSGAGKTTIAELLAAAGGGAVVHTDDVAWNHSRFGWHGRLVERVLTPVRVGERLDWRPVEWPDDKPDAIRVPAGVRLLVVEGVGAAGLRDHTDRLVWVQSDLDDAERRGIARDVVLGRTPAEARRFWDEWMEDEVPYLAAERPWERADLVVRGGAGDRDVLLVAPAIHPAGRQ